jgi:hypothetical protein
MQWHKHSTDHVLTESAADEAGNRFQILAKRGTKQWQVFQNGQLVTDKYYTRHNAKALVDPTLEPREDKRKYNGRGDGFPVQRKPRRTNDEIAAGMDALCVRCNQRCKKTGALVEVSPLTWEHRKFSFCSDCLQDFVLFIQPIVRPINPVMEKTDEISVS